MSRCLPALLLLILLTGCASMMSRIKPVTGEVLSLSIERANKSKSELYVLANSWAVDRFVSAESVIEFQDKEAGIIKGKYLARVEDGLYFFDIKTTITIQVKDEKSRIVLTDPLSRVAGDKLNGAYYPTRNYAPIDTQKILDKAQRSWNALVDSFQDTMTTEELNW